MLKKTLALVLCTIIACSFAALPASAEGSIPEQPAITIEYGKTLADATLVSGYSWASDSTIARYKLGDQYFLANYDANGDGVYEQTDIQVSVTVVCTKHSWGEYKSDGNAKLFEDGTKTRICKICGEKETVTDENSSKTVSFILSEKFNSGLTKVIGAVISVINKVISFVASSIGSTK